MRIRRWLAGFFLLLVLFPQIAVAQNGSPVTYSGTELTKRLDGFFAEHGEETVGVNVSVFTRDEVLYEKYHGYENREENRPMNEESVVEWGSVTKLLTWVSVMQLVEQGKLDLQADIRAYLPDGFLRKLRFETPVTLTDLMNHQAGFEDVLVELFVKDGANIASLGETLGKRQPEQVFEPGDTTAYSNWGTALAAYIVERQSGIDFADYVHQNIFKPLKMEHTALRPDFSDNPWVQKAREKLASYVNDGSLLEDSFYYIPLYPAGMSTGTLRDFQTFAQALLATDGVPLFKNPETIRQLFNASSVYTKSGRARNAHGFWVHYFGTVAYGHGGNTAGCTSYLTVDPVSGVGAVVMTNQQGESSFTAGIQLLVFGSFTGSPFDDTTRTLPTGLLRTTRAVFKGPLSISQLMVEQSDESDLESYWEMTEIHGRKRMQMLYFDFIEMTARETAFLFFTIGTLVLGAIYGFITLLIQGIGRLIRRTTKKDPLTPTDRNRKWNLAGLLLLVLFPVNFVVFIAQIMLFQPFAQYQWQVVLTAAMGLAMAVILVVMLKGFFEVGLPMKRKAMYFLTSLFLATSLFHILYWQMYQFWAL